MIEKIRRYLRERSYHIGIVEKNIFHESFDFSKDVKWIDLDGYNHGWFADPFIFKVETNEIHILAEEYEYYNDKGRLVYLVVDRKSYKIKSLDVILELETHLSFPIYIIDNDKIFIYPENAEGNGFKIYEFDLQSKRLINPILLIKAPLLDTQIIKIDKKFYAMGVIYEDNGQSCTKTLNIYESSSLLGPYVFKQTIENFLCEERGAGMFFKDGGKLIRPAQCCEGDYGKAVIFYEIELKNDVFSEREVKRISPIKSSKYGLCLHTFNYKDGLSIIDGNEFRHWRIGRFISKLHDK